MRRSRARTAPDTFPFLAVLLCAMGSLILVLLVMDRRAKLAARSRVEQAAARRDAELAREAERLRAEHERRRAEARAAWQQKRDALHARLTAEQEALAARLRQVRAELSAAEARLRADDPAAAPDRRLAAERQRLAAAEKALADRRAALGKTAAEVEAAGAFLGRMTADLLQAEQTLAQLKAARARERQTYSVVPYRGRHGNSRRPLYIECAAGGLIFHPERVPINPGLFPSQVRGEVERRVARQREVLAVSGATPDATPYLLLLIRPDGVRTYYELQAALRGVDVEFGYELIDADWALDFPEDDQAPAAQWAGAAGSGGSALVPGVNNPHRGTAGQAPGPGAGGHGSAAFGADGPGSGGGFSAGSGHPSALPPAGPAGGPGGRGVVPGRPGSSGAPSVGVGLGAASRDGTAPRGYGPTNSGGPDGTAGPAGTGPGAPRLIASSRGMSPAGVPGKDGAPAAKPGAPGAAEPGSRSGDTQPSASAGSGTPGAKAPGDVAVGTPAGETKGAQERRPTPDDRRRDAEEPRRRPRGLKLNPLATPSGEPGDDPPLPLAPPEDPRAGRRTPPALRPARLRGDRDWVLFLECRPDSVVLHPSRVEVPVSALLRGPGENPLLVAVRAAIDRKQATVRAGDPPYRPVVRFLVRPESLRTFHQAYPALDALAVPKQRHNLEPEDDVASVIAGN